MKLLTLIGGTFGAGLIIWLLGQLGLGRSHVTDEAVAAWYGIAS